MCVKQTIFFTFILFVVKIHLYKKFTHINVLAKQKYISKMISNFYEIYKKHI
jgi:hypothetical protein